MKKVNVLTQMIVQQLVHNNKYRRIWSDFMRKMMPRENGIILPPVQETFFTYFIKRSGSRISGDKRLTWCMNTMSCEESCTWWF